MREYITITAPKTPDRQEQKAMGIDFIRGMASLGVYDGCRPNQLRDIAATIEAALPSGGTFAVGSAIALRVAAAAIEDGEEPW